MITQAIQKQVEKKFDKIWHVQSIKQFLEPALLKQQLVKNDQRHSSESSFQSNYSRQSKEITHKITPGGRKGYHMHTEESNPAKKEVNLRDMSVEDPESQFRQHEDKGLTRQKQLQQPQISQAYFHDHYGYMPMYLNIPSPYVSNQSGFMTSDQNQRSYNSLEKSQVQKQGQRIIIIEDTCCQLRGDIYSFKEGDQLNLLENMAEMGVARCSVHSNPSITVLIPLRSFKVVKRPSENFFYSKSQEKNYSSLRSPDKSIKTQSPERKKLKIQERKKKVQQAAADATQVSFR